MEHIDVSNQSLAAQEAEINRFVIRTTDLKDPVVATHTCFLHIEIGRYDDHDDRLPESFLSSGVDSSLGFGSLCVFLSSNCS